MSFKAQLKNTPRLLHGTTAAKLHPEKPVTGATLM